MPLDASNMDEKQLEELFSCGPGLHGSAQDAMLCGNHITTQYDTTENLRDMNERFSRMIEDIKAGNGAKYIKLVEPQENPKG